MIYIIKDIMILCFNLCLAFKICITQWETKFGDREEVFEYLRFFVIIGSWYQLLFFSLGPRFH